MMKRKDIAPPPSPPLAPTAKYGVEVQLMVTALSAGRPEREILNASVARGFSKPEAHHLLELAIYRVVRAQRAESIQHAYGKANRIRREHDAKPNDEECRAIAHMVNYARTLRR